MCSAVTTRSVYGPRNLLYGQRERGMRKQAIVIGAGVAGLSAARELAAAGRDVLVLEARDRIGGRIRTIDLAGAIVDLGASWLHGPHQNPLTAFLAEEGIGWRRDGAIGHRQRVALDGQWVMQHEASSVATALHEWDPAESIEALGPGIDDLGAAFDWYVHNRCLDERTAGITREALRRFIGYAVTGNAPEDISLHGFADYVEHGGGNAVLEGGYRALVDRLADGLDIRLGSPVTRVEHARQGVKVQTGDAEITVDLAILTVPLGVLQAGTIEVDPALPDGAAAALDRLRMSALEKVVMRFDRPVWTDGMQTLLTLDTGHPFSVFHDMTPHTGAPMLVAFFNPAITGEARSPDGWADRALEVLRTHCPDVSEPVTTVTTEWSGDPWSRGAYSYIPVGASAADMDALAAPISSSLVIAGEHTVAAYSGTVHGAFVSGRRAAARMLGH